MQEGIMRRSLSIALAILVFVLPQLVFAQPSQTLDLIYNEARTIYLGNLARQQNGLPPLRWNAQLTKAARWFSWDSVENRPDGFCGHQDTQGHWPDWRALAFGYLGFAGAENAFCGYVTPEQAIDGWMNSPGHRANLLDTNSREIGLGYYLRQSDQRGYLTQDFGHDRVYPPVVIENEALNTTSSHVDLYIYGSEAGGGFTGMGAPVQMLVGNDACFSGAAWENYIAEKTWNLEPGEGWRSVYVKTRDALSRTVTVSDTIYLGADLPLDELGQSQMSTTRDRLQLQGLEAGGLPLVQFSLGWAVDDSNGNFSLLWGNGESVADPQARAGSAMRMTPGNGESSAWVWTTEFFHDTPMVAYVRLKVSDNSSDSEVARVAVTGGNTLNLKGTDFAAAGQYQEFPIPFTFEQSETFLIFQFWRSGAADVYVDGATIFSAPQPADDSIEWQIPGGNYRGQGLWLRYTDGGNQFSAVQTYDSNEAELRATPEALLFLVAENGPSPAAQTLTVEQRGCSEFQWDVSSDVGWLSAKELGPTVLVQVDPDHLGLGSYDGQLTFSAVDLAGVADFTVPVTLIVSDQIYPVFLPIAVSHGK
jgi:uncharacterized protein YkwD